MKNIKQVTLPGKSRYNLLPTKILQQFQFLKYLP